jgi:hypothetical protein
MQREESPTLETGLERIAAKARSEPKLRFTSLAHHVTRERVWENLCQISKDSSPGVDGQTVPEAKENFGEWIEAMLQSSGCCECIPQIREWSGNGITAG